MTSQHNTKESGTLAEPQKQAEFGSAQLIAVVLKHRGTSTQMRSLVARGLNPETETYAMPYVNQYCPNRSAQTAYLRAAGIAAHFKNIKDGELSLGTSLRQLSAKLSGKAKFTPNPNKQDIVGKRIATLHEQDLEEAVNTIRRLMDLSAGTDVTFNFRRIAKLLERWGNGYSEESRKVRIQILSDYWGGWDEKNTDNIKSITTTEATIN